MLELKNVTVSYGPVKALDEVSLKVESGTTAIIGLNGAGKSSLLKVVSGLVPCKSGQILWEGREIHSWPAEKRVKLGIIHVLEGRRLFHDQTVQDNLLLSAVFRSHPPLSRSEVAQRLDEIYQIFPLLYHKRRQLAGTLSGGQQQLLVLASAMLVRPKLLLIDEPSLGLAPKIIQEIYDVIKGLSQKGLTIVLAEQLVNMALRYATHGYVLENGKLLQNGTIEELRNSLGVK